MRKKPPTCIHGKTGAFGAERGQPDEPCVECEAINQRERLDRAERDRQPKQWDQTQPWVEWRA